MARRTGTRVTIELSNENSINKGTGRSGGWYVPWITGQNTFVSIAATFPALCRNVAGMRAGEIIRDVRIIRLTRRFLGREFDGDMRACIVRGLGY